MEIKEIFVVDDSPSARFVLGRLLERHGFDVVMVSSGEQALGLLELRQPDLILMDYTMRGMNGLEATRQIRQSWRTENIPVVLLTANDDPEFAAQARSHGAVAVLPKNSDPDSVLKLIRGLEEGSVPVMAAPVREPAVVEEEEEAATGRSEIEAEVLLAEVSDRLRGRLEPVIADTLREVFEYCERVVKVEADRVLPRLRRDVEHAIRELTDGLVEQMIRERLGRGPVVGTLKRRTGVPARPATGSGGSH